MHSTVLPSIHLHMNQRKTQLQIQVPGVGASCKFCAQLQTPYSWALLGARRSVKFTSWQVHLVVYVQTKKGHILENTNWHKI